MWPAKKVYHEGLYQVSKTVSSYLIVSLCGFGWLRFYFSYPVRQHLSSPFWFRGLLSYYKKVAQEGSY